MAAVTRGALKVGLLALLALCLAGGLLLWRGHAHVTGGAPPGALLVESTVPVAA